MGRDSPEIPIEVRDFCARNRIENEVHATLSLAKRHFAMVGSPALRLVDDDGANQHYVGIHLRAKGDADEVFEQSEAFLDSFLDTIDREKQLYINVIYHIERS